MSLMRNRKRLGQLCFLVDVVVDLHALYRLRSCFWRLKMLNSRLIHVIKYFGTPVYITKCKSHCHQTLSYTALQSNSNKILFFVMSDWNSAFHAYWSKVNHLLRSPACSCQRQPLILATDTSPVICAPYSISRHPPRPTELLNTLGCWSLIHTSSLHCKPRQK